MRTDPVRALEFYSGIGGLNLALQRSQIAQPGAVIRAFDWDQAACQVYKENHGPGPTLSKIDILTLTAGDLAPLKANLWLLSPSCQPYTVLNATPKDSADPRAKSFLHLIQHVLPDLVSAGQHPSRLLIENVGGFETSSTRQLLLTNLKLLGYTTCELLLTPLQFGIPNSRLRYYLLAKIGPLTFPVAMEGVVWRHIPGRGQDWVDIRSSENTDTSVKEISHYLDHDIGAEPSVVPDRVLEKWGKLFDIVLPTSKRSCCFTRGYIQLVERAGSILQMNETLDTTTAFNLFVEAQAADDRDAVRLLDPLRLRYFTPSELLRLFHFDIPGDLSHKSFVWPEGISSKTKYRLIGNSVNVKVVTALIDFLFDQPRSDEA